MKRGVYIIFEGPDGVGKTTLATALVSVLRTTGRYRDVMSIAEPYNRKVIDSLKDSTGKKRPPEMQLREFMIDRLNMVDKLEKVLAEGSIVVQDRSYLSSAAYQGAQGLSAEVILQVHEWLMPPPDLIFLMDMGIDYIMDRVAKREENNKGFSRDFMCAVRSQYQSMVSRYDDGRLICLDAAKSINDSLDIVLRHFGRVSAKWFGYSPK